MSLEIKKQQIIAKYNKSNKDNFLQNIKEEELSDLHAEDIPDEDVSDVSQSELDLDALPEVETNAELETKI